MRPEDKNISVAWFETEEGLMECVDEVKRSGCQIVEAIEIGSCREIDVKE